MWLSVLFWLFSSVILLFPVFHVMKEFRLTLSGTDMEIRGGHVCAGNNRPAGTLASRKHTAIRRLIQYLKIP